MMKGTKPVNPQVASAAAAKGITVVYRPLKGYWVEQGRSSSDETVIWVQIGSTITQALAWLDEQ
jgi:hypothetical protein